MTAEATLRCRACRRVLPATDFRRIRGGYSARCLACIDAAAKPARRINGLLADVVELLLAVARGAR